MKQMLQKLSDKNSKVKQMKIQGRWKRLIDGVLGKRKNEPEPKSDVLKRWTKLILKAQRRGVINLKSMQEMDMQTMISQLKEKEEKLRIMNVYRKWRSMTNLLLTRNQNKVSSKTMKRWHKLILKASRQGLITLKTLQSLDLSEMIAQLR